VIVLRRKSNKANEEAKEAAPAASAAPVAVHRKAKPDIYTVFLVIALVAVITGIVFLYLELQRYDFKHQGGPPVSMVRQQDPKARGMCPVVCNTALAQHAIL
jgi:cytochrome c-type biogenesis protein CcmH/NrfG